MERLLEILNTFPIFDKNGEGNRKCHILLALVQKKIRDHMSALHGAIHQYETRQKESPERLKKMHNGWLFFQKDLDEAMRSKIGNLIKL